MLSDTMVTIARIESCIIILYTYWIHLYNITYFIQARNGKIFKSRIEIRAQINPIGFISGADGIQ